MKQGKRTNIGWTWLALGTLTLLIWLYVIQGAIGEPKEVEEAPEPFIPSETISPHQEVAFPVDI